VTVVYTPQPSHTCDVGAPEPCHDTPGTVRRCNCGRFWAAEKYPEVRGGQQRVGVFWRPEKRRERSRREKAHREARMAPSPSTGPLQAPSAGLGPIARMFLPEQLPEIWHGRLVTIQGLEGCWRVNDLAKLDDDGAWHFRVEPVQEPAGEDG
jgi:hypothetical protein